MDVPLPWERLLWRGRSLLFGRLRYALTDFRFVRIDGARSEEIALHDVGEVHRVRSLLDRAARTSTLLITHRRGLRPPLIVRHIRRGPQVAALLELLSGDPTASIDLDAVNAALSFEPATSRAVYVKVLAVVIVMTLGVSAVVTGLHGKASAVVYSPDDAIYPDGVKRDRATIVRFMEQQVLPWAREALAPIKGGADRISCETCHGRSAEARGWRMPAVAALPQPDVVVRGWETYSSRMDNQMRNAIYGYLAESDNQARAAYMREVVMPGMAQLLHRPPYDFTKTYAYNRTRNAFGCYHCHMVGEQ